METGVGNQDQDLESDSGSFHSFNLFMDEEERLL